MHLFEKECDKKYKALEKELNLFTEHKDLIVEEFGYATYYRITQKIRDDIINIFKQWTE